MGIHRNVLLVDDNEDHRFFTKRALRSFPGETPVTYEAADGDEALRFLRREGEHANAPRPDLVLLDLKMPRLDGFAVLEALRGDPHLSSIPVVVLTSSEHERDVDRARALGARGYLTKPLDASGFAAALGPLLQGGPRPSSEEAKS